MSLFWTTVLRVSGVKNVISNHIISSPCHAPYVNVYILGPSHACIPSAYYLLYAAVVRLIRWRSSRRLHIDRRLQGHSKLPRGYLRTFPSLSSTVRRTPLAPPVSLLVNCEPMTAVALARYLSARSGRRVRASAFIHSMYFSVPTSQNPWSLSFFQLYCNSWIRTSVHPSLVEAIGATSVAFIDNI